MRDLDKWLEDAAKATRSDLPKSHWSMIQTRVGLEPAPVVLALKNNARLVMACAAISAFIACIGMSSLMSNPPRNSAAMWISSPPAASPYGLLIGH